MYENAKYANSPHRIKTIMRDGTFQFLTTRVLDLMLESNLVLKFKNSSGWVNVGVDPVRMSHVESTYLTYNGSERRHNIKHTSLTASEVVDL